MTQIVEIEYSPSSGDGVIYPKDSRGTSLVVYDDDSWIMNCWHHGCQRMTSSPRRGTPAWSLHPTSHIHQDGTAVAFVEPNGRLFDA